MEKHNIQTLMDTEIEAVGGGMTGNVVRGESGLSGWMCWVWGCTPPVINIVGGD